MPDTRYSTAIGGRHGSIRRDDGLLDLKLALSQTLGAKSSEDEWSLQAGGDQEESDHIRPNRDGSSSKLRRVGIA